MVLGLWLSNNQMQSSISCRTIYEVHLRSIVDTGIIDIIKKTSYTHYEGEVRQKVTRIQ